MLSIYVLFYIYVAIVARLIYHLDMTAEAPRLHLPKYRQIYNALRGEITAGELASGQRLPSEAQLVKAFGASRITVGRALRDLQHAGLVERRAGSGTYVLATPRKTAAQSCSFGLLIPDLAETEILEPIAQGLTSAPAARPHAIISGAAGGGEDKAAIAWERCQQFIDRRVDGVFFAPLELTAAKDVTNARITEALDNAGIPIVLLDRPVQPYGLREEHDLVGIDNRRAGYRMAEHLLRLGSRRVAFASLAHAASTVDARQAGYREALHRYGAPVEGALILQLEGADTGAVQAFMSRGRPDAIVCANDRMAGLVLQALMALGYAVPGDVRIVGIDDVRYASLLPVPLTTLRQPCREIGAAAMAAMLDRLARPELAPRDIFLHPSLIVRKSCGALAARTA